MPGAAGVMGLSHAAKLMYKIFSEFYKDVAVMLIFDKSNK
jgi:hypothetical protein